MMRLEDYLSSHAPGAGPSDSGWLALCEITLASGRLLLVDPTLYPDGGCEVHLASGTYSVQVIVHTECEEHRIGCLRITRDPAGVPGRTVGEVSVDFAQLGVGDPETIAPAAESIATPEMAEPIWAALNTHNLSGTVPWCPENGVAMPFVSTGYGDGRYVVRELLHEGARVGIFVDFLEGME